MRMLITDASASSFLVNRTDYSSIPVRRAAPAGATCCMSRVRMLELAVEAADESDWDSMDHAPSLHTQRESQIVGER